MKVLKQILCTHQYRYKGWQKTCRCFSCILSTELVFRCEKCGKYTSLFENDLLEEQKEFFKQDVAEAPLGFRVELTSCMLSGDEGFAVYDRYLHRGIDLKQVEQFDPSWPAWQIDGIAEINEMK